MVGFEEFVRLGRATVLNQSSTLSSYERFAKLAFVGTARSGSEIPAGARFGIKLYGDKLASFSKNIASP